MEEKQKNDQKPEFKGNLGFVWLIGILVILLGCVTIYTLKITADNKELKQASEVDQRLSEEVKNLAEEEYTNNLTDAQNGKVAFYKIIKNNELQTEKYNGFYVYVDPFEKEYSIKEIKDVVSEKGIMGTDNWAALFKVTVTYIDNNDNTKTMKLAIILLPNHEVQNMGTYDNYTGTTSFVKSFTKLNEQTDNSSSNQKYSDKELKEIKQTIENYYKLISAKENSPILMLTDVLKLKVYEVQDPAYAPSNYIEHPNSNKYSWTGIKYNDFENELWYVSDNLLKSDFSEFVEYKDYLYVNDNNNNKYNFKYEIIKQEINEKSTLDTCICDVTIKNSKTGKTLKKEIKMSRGNGDFIIISINNKK